MFDGNLRFGVDRVTSPIGRLLVRAGVSADQITVVGLLMSVAAAVSIGMGRPPAWPLSSYIDGVT